MKRITVVILYFILITHYKCQSITISDILKFSNSTYENFDTQILKKGYEFQGNESTDKFKVYTYRYIIKNSLFSKIAKIKAFNGTSSIYFHTKNKENYLNIKSQMQNLGYTFLKEKKSTEGNPIFIYEKGNEEFSFTPFVDKRNSSFYEITYSNYVY